MQVLQVPKAPSHGFMIRLRFELRLVEETLAARRAASAHAIRQLGFDETTKEWDERITSNFIIEPTKGAPLEPLILRGAYCSAVAARFDEVCATCASDICILYTHTHIVHIHIHILYTYTSI